MPRIRTIKPEAPQHRKVGPLSDRAFRVWIVLLTQADDEGRLVCDQRQVLVWAFSYHRDVTEQQVEDAIQEVARPGLIRLYAVNGTRYALFPSWGDHQKINRPNPSKLPAPPSLLDTLSARSMGAHGALSEDSRSTHAGSRIKDQGTDQGGEGKGSEGMQGGPREGEPHGARSASPSETASLAPVGSHSTGEPRAASNGGKCRGVTKGNLECVRPALPGSDYCPLHQDQGQKNGNGDGRPEIDRDVLVVARKLKHGARRSHLVNEFGDELVD